MLRPMALLWLVMILSMTSTAWGAKPTANNVYADGITLAITSRPFDPKAHKIQQCDGTVCAIDGKPLYGTYGKIPTQEVVSLVFEKNGKKVALDVTGMYNPNVNNSNIKKYIQVKPWGEDTYEVTGYFSRDDGDDDMYICLWLIMQGSSVRNYIGGYETLASLTNRVQKDFNVE